MNTFSKIFNDVVTHIQNWTLNDQVLWDVNASLDRKQKQELIEILDQNPRYYLDRNEHYVRINDTLKEELHGKPQFVLWKNSVNDDYYYTY